MSFSDWAFAFGEVWKRILILGRGSEILNFWCLNNWYWVPIVPI